MSDDEVVELTPRQLQAQLRRQRAERNLGSPYIPPRRPIVQEDEETIDLVSMIAGIKYNIRGDAVITLVIPKQYTAFVGSLPSYISKLVHVTFRKWMPDDVTRVTRDDRTG